MFSGKLEYNCHYWASSWNCVTRCQALQGFSPTTQVSLHENNKISISSVPVRSQEVIVAFQFITVYVKPKVF